MDRRGFTRQVLGQLSCAETSSEALQSPASEANVILVIAWIPAQQAAPALMECAALLRFGFRIKVLTQESSKLQPYLLPGMTASDAPVQDWSSIHKILMLPDRSQTANLTLGIPSGNAENVVLHALWDNRPVYADYSAMLLWDKKPCANAVLRTLYQSYRKTLASFGVQEVCPGEYLHTLLDEQPPELSQSPEAQVERPRKMVLTGNDILQTATETVLQLPHNVIVTPLARDLAVKRGIRLEIMTNTERAQ